MTDLMLVVVVGLLWAIYAALKSCLAELKEMRARADVTNGLLVGVSEHAEALRFNLGDLDGKVEAIEAATTAFHEHLIRSANRN